MCVELKTLEGKYKTLDQLYDDFKDELVSELDCMNNEDALYLGNKIRGKNDYNLLFENNEECINQEVNGDPWDILNAGWDDYSEFFTWDGYEFEMTDDVWSDLDTDDIAEEIIDGKWYDELPWDIQQMVDEYNEAKEKLENLNKYRAEGEEILARFTNCEADVSDLLQYIDRITKTDDVWKENQ